MKTKKEAIDCWLDLWMDCSVAGRWSRRAVGWKNVAGLHKQDKTSLIINSIPKNGHGIYGHISINNQSGLNLVVPAGK